MCNVYILLFYYLIECCKMLNMKHGYQTCLMLINEKKYNVNLSSLGPVQLSEMFNNIINRLDLGSIRSSLRYGLSTLYLYRLTIRNMEDLHLVLPALNLSTLNAGILIMMQKVRLMMFSLNMVDYSMSFLLLST